MEMISQFLLSFLLNSLWQVTLIVTVAYFCQRLLQNTSARIQHFLWVITLFLSICIPVITNIDFSYFSFATPQNIIVQPLIKPIVHPLPHLNSANLPLEITPINPLVTLNKNVSFLLITLFLFFLVYRVIQLLRALKETQTIRNKAFVMAHSQSILAVVEECKNAFKMPNAQILYSSEISSPITLGIFNPLIILPPKLAEENDRNILLSAIGHELVHIKRRDYLFNLLYEFLYLPLSFHPATLLMKRRIKVTRELRCDELVTDKLLSPNIYAQSLVQLAGSAIDFGRHSTITIGIGDADILEKRIMKILKKSKMTVQQRNLLLVATSILFVAVFAVAITFTIRPVIAQQVTKLDKIQEEKQKAELEYEVTLSKQSPEEKLARQKAELEEMNKLAKLAKVSMAQAIEIATKEVSGTILECKLVVYNVKSKDPNSKESSQLFYYVRIATDQVEKNLLINTIDGKVSTPTFTTIRDKN